ncbi:uncharacterized protein LOC130673988 [Microplitis mediator]|uniref:uncharacterized protein LOC130673988 n=1 Tax=Microplitis mediator TaxID=375433 RepID=UPI00255674D8|nr:uncharacterized protein LOC130673988 [Microplitis mediator]
MDNFLVKLLITLTIHGAMSAIIPDNSHLLSLRTNLIIGPETPVFYVKYSSDNKVEFNRSDNVFEASVSYDYYKNPANDRTNTFVLNVLVVCDYKLQKYVAQKDLLQTVLEKWDETAVRLSQLQNPQIKLRIAGIIVPEHPDIFGLSNLGNSSCYPQTTSFNRLISWFSDHFNNFRDLKYNFVAFMSGQDVCSENTKTKLTSGSSLWSSCSDNQEILAPLLNGALINYIPAHFGLYATQLIAKKFGVQSDQDLGCGTDYIMSSEVHPSYPWVWSDCSKAAFEKIINNPAYACYKM